MQTIRDLGDGLILRSATIEDAERLMAFHAEIHRPHGHDEPAEWIATLVRDLFQKAHPTMAPGNFTLVEQATTGRIVSSLCLIPQTWAYRAVPFGVGRPELVSTHPDFRRRGLVRAQMEVIHEWSAERGHLVQAITGIPWYYRQFGYEMAVNLGGGRAGYEAQVPALKDGQAEPYLIRPATESDLGFMSRVYDWASRRSLVTCLRDDVLWSYELSGRSPGSANRIELAIIEARGGEPLGFLAWSSELWRKRVALRVYELDAGADWLEVSPSVFRFLWAAGSDLAALEPGSALAEVAFMLGAEHPSFLAIRGLLPNEFRTYAWYVRVPDLAAFITRIAPVLNDRLAASLAPSYSGQLRISFYRSGLRLAFESGHLATVEPWMPIDHSEAEAAFPGLVFLQLLFGYRSLQDLMAAFPDCWASDEARVMLDSLWPRVASYVWPVG